MRVLTPGYAAPVIDRDRGARRLSSWTRRRRPPVRHPSKVDSLRPTYGFDDVSLAPGLETVEPADVDTSVAASPASTLAIPVLASAMDAVVDARFGGALAPARRPGGAEPRGRPDALRGPRAGARADRRRRPTTRSQAVLAEAYAGPSARTWSPAGSRSSMPRARGPRSRRRRRPRAGSAPSARSTARTCSSSSRRSPRRATWQAATNRSRWPSSRASCRSRSPSATRRRSRRRTS